jgi:hypothetical protein
MAPEITSPAPHASIRWWSCMAFRTGSRFAGLVALADGACIALNVGLSLSERQLSSDCNVAEGS